MSLDTPKSTLSWTLCGPPFLNGALHVGHGVNFIIKDFTLRYQTEILNVHADWTYNFDCHGLPIEREVQKTLQPGEDLVSKCLELNDRCYKEGSDTLNKLNLLHPVTLKNTVCTNEVQYKVKLMNFLSNLYAENKLYRKQKHTPYCHHCASSLANAEIEKKQIKEYIYLIIANITSGVYKSNKLLFATTELETVYQNTAIGLNPDHLYGLEEGMISGVPAGVLIKGSELEGASYQIIVEDKSIYGSIVCSKEVHSNLSSEDTVLSTYASVGLSPWGGELDYKLVVENNILTPDEIKQTAEIQRVERIETIKKNRKVPLLKKLPRSILQEICWRCGHKVSLALTEQWYIEINSKERTILSGVGDIGCNDKKTLLQTAKFFSNPTDWNISRSREYGTPLPLIHCPCGIVRGVEYSVSDFLDRTECFPAKIPAVLKRKGVDLNCDCGGVFTPTPYSVDVWVDSGFLPLYFGLPEVYPTLIEGIDQKRGWFYTTAVLSVLKNQRLPYENLYYTGWILNNARKVSKSNNTLGTLDDLLKNTNVLNLRSYALTNANSANTEYSLNLVESQKKYINTILNIKKFLELDDIKQAGPVDPQMFNVELNKLKELELTLHNCFINLQYDKYWVILKDHLLQIYSRGYINLYKSNMTTEQAAFLKHYGLVLLKYASPVLGEF